MTNLKNRILQTLQNGKNVETILNDLSKSQENLLKNHSNPVFSKQDKNKILKHFTNLQNIGKSLYRYNALNENNLEADAEKADIENTVLKGGISYNKYVWHSENGEHTCDVCKSLDGNVFDFYDEVPERPHPNCRCTVEVVENIEEESNPEGNTSSNDEKQPTKEETKWLPPCNGPITSPYGWRVHPIYKTQKFHNGWDIGVPIGTPVKAVADGKIYYAGRADGYGKMVVIDHGKINGTTVTSEYGHISSWEVSSVQYVKQGQVIAKSGNEGTSSGPHLHITIREGAYRGKAEDPSKYIEF